MPKNNDKKLRRLRMGLLLIFLVCAGTAVVLYRHHAANTVWGRSGALAQSYADATFIRDGKTYVLRPDTVLQMGDTVVTGSQGVELVQHNGTVVRLAPQSRLVLGPLDVQSTDLQLLAGAVRIESQAGDPSFTVGTPFGIVRTSTYSLNVADISMGAVYVRVGEITVIHGPDTQKVGHGFKSEGGGKPEPIAKNDPVVLEDLVFSMQRVAAVPVVPPDDAPSSAYKPHSDNGIHLLPAASTRWLRAGVAMHVPANPQPLLADDQVLTFGEGAVVGLGKWGKMQIHPDAGVRVAAIHQDANQIGVSVIVEHGDVDFLLTKQAGKQPTLGLRIAGHEAVVHAGFMAGAGHVVRQQERLKITLQMGEIQVEQQRIEAGTMVVLDANGVSVHPLAAQTAPVRPGRPTVLHTAKNAPTLAFMLPGKKDGAAHLVEVARDANFHDVRFAEKLRGDRFVVEPGAGGHTLYWRVDHGAPSALRTMPPPPDNCTHCLGIDPISDEVRHTEVRYDDVMPELGFTWRPHTDADYYLFRLWRANNFDRPVAIQHTKDPNVTLDGGSIGAGEYVWKVADYDPEGNLVRTSELYELTVVSNRHNPLDISEPALSSMTRQDSIQTQGSAAPGQKLSCNETPMQVDADGGFKGRVPLHPGHNFLYYVLSEDGVDHVFIREVERQAPTGH